MSRRGSGVRVTESLWGGYVEEYLSCGREGGRWERCRVSRQMGARWTVTATSEGVRGIGFACWDRTRVRIRRTNRGLQDPLSSLPTPEQTKRVQNHDACIENSLSLIFCYFLSEFRSPESVPRRLGCALSYRHNQLKSASGGRYVFGFLPPF